MTQEEVPVFRSDTPHLMTVAEAGGDAVSPPPSDGHEGSVRQINDSTLFAPLDEPRVLSETETPVVDADEAGLVSGSEAETHAAQTGQRSGDSEAAVSEALADEAIGLRRVSPELVARALEIRSDTEAIAGELQVLIQDLPALDPLLKEEPELTVSLAKPAKAGKAAKDSK
jgi:hypothetical protein